MAMERKRTSREEWRKRIERWKSSGLSAEEFASELGINAGTLRQWKFILGREARQRVEQGSAVEASTGAGLPIVELRTTSIEQAQHFELQLSDRRWLKIPARFERVALEQILAVVERKA